VNHSAPVAGAAISEMIMRAKLAVPAALALALATAGPAAAATIKIGVIGPFSGSQTIFGNNYSEAIAVFQKMHGDTIDGNKIEVIKRDLPTANPLKARAIAQELIVKDGVQYIGGLVNTPDVLAVATLVNQAHIPTVIFTAASSTILPKSKYFLRANQTIAQIAAPEAVYARSKGYKSAVSLVIDYAPGWDGEQAYGDAFEKSGGKIVGKIRVPLSTTDYAPFLERAKLLHPDVIFGFVPAGGPAFQLLTAYNNSGIRRTVPYLGQGETDEIDLPHYGGAALGLVNVQIYSGSHKGKENDDFKAVLHQLYPNSVAVSFQAQAYDGMSLIYHMIEATHGQKDGDKAIASVLGYTWQGLRGPMKIDPTTRDLIQNVYMRRVEKDPVTGKEYNQEFLAYPMQPDYGRPGVALPTLETLKGEPVP
jgi:branched-chain amino acid transport system substrate-binding protein